MKPIRLISGFLTVGSWTLASRVVGFARDILIAAFLGTGPIAEPTVIVLAPAAALPPSVVYVLTTVLAVATTRAPFRPLPSA